MLTIPSALLSRLRRDKSRHRSDFNTATPRSAISAAVLHVDIVGSTDLVRRNMMLAHQQIQALYFRLSHIATRQNGITRELRGDAAVIHFPRSRDAGSAALSIHSTNSLMNSTRIGRIAPRLRTGISYGPVIVGDGVITGEAVIRAQRMEQLAVPGKVLFDQNTYDELDEQTGFAVHRRGSENLKGFSEPITVYEAVNPSAPSICELSSLFQTLLAAS